MAHCINSARSLIKYSVNECRKLAKTAEIVSVLDLKLSLVFLVRLQYSIGDYHIAAISSHDKIAQKRRSLGMQAMLSVYVFYS